MHLWKVTYHVGDFGVKQLTITTCARAADSPDADGNPRGGFAEVEHQALLATQSETSGWPNPIEIVAIEYVDELPAIAAAASPKPAKGRK